VDLDDLFEIQFLKINVHSSHKKVNEITLFEFVISDASQCL
jgi:hypothetical protein